MAHRIIIFFIRIVRNIIGIFSCLRQLRFRIAFPHEPAGKYNASQFIAGISFQILRNFADRNGLRYGKTDLFGNRIILRRICRCIDRRIGKSSYRNLRTAFRPCPAGRQRNIG